MLSEGFIDLLLFLTASFTYYFFPILRDFLIFSAVLLGLVFARQYLLDYFASKQKLKQSISGEWALVTGASYGIGLDLAKLLAKEGCNIVLVARSENKLQEAKKLLQSLHPQGKFEIIVKDLTTPNAPQEIVSELKKKSIFISVLVNNAGFGEKETFSESRQYSEMIAVNIDALTTLTRLLLPEMIEKNKGKILNIGSTAGMQPGPSMAVYYATKSFVNLFSEALSFELRGTNVTCTLLCPGATESEFANRAGSNDSYLFTSFPPMKSSDVARDGIHAMMTGQRKKISGIMNLITATGSSLLPNSLILWVSAFVLKKAK